VSELWKSCELETAGYDPDMGDIRQTVERELKLGADRAFVLPELPGDALPERAFTSTYHDTVDHRLARAGVTLRRRVESRKGLWQLKLPRGVARLELELPGPPVAPPEQLLELLTAYRRGAELVPVAVLRTRRSGLRTAPQAGAVAEVTVDAVSVSIDRRTVRAFRELEVELLEGDEKGLKRIGKALRAAGAVEGDARPKLFQALDLEPPATPAPPAKSAPPHEHLQAMLGAQYRAVLAHDPGTRLGTDPEDLHQMRVATRRLRAFLRAGLPLLEPEWAESLRLELGWLGGALGPVRDLDVLAEHLESDATKLERQEQRALKRVFAHLAGERGAARATLLEALRSERYLRLLDRLEDAAREPKRGVDEPPLRDLAAAEFRRLRKAARALDPDPPDDDLHDLRIRGKRARYAAELAETSTGKPTTRFIQEAKAFQDVLGEHQDAAVADTRVRGLLRELGGPATAFAIGRLVERQGERKRAARAAFPAAWKRLERRGREAWS
jgi:CHAD domain-containing protein